MTEPVKFEEALRDRHDPTVGVWNRLEGRPRTTSFDRALRVEVRDPLWMLTRQWQLGEFIATDGGSPVTATYAVDAAKPSSYRPDGGGVIPLPATQPLESVAERRALPFTFGADPVGFDLRLAIGHRWLKMINGFLVGELLNRFRRQYVRLYPIALPDPKSDQDSARVAHPEVWATMQALAGRHLDGYLLYRHLKYDQGAKASDGITDILLQLHFPRINQLGLDLVKWFDALIEQPADVKPAKPEGDDSWNAGHLEHRFSVSAALPGGKEKVLTAQEYPGGRLDWHAFSVDTVALGGATVAPESLYRTVFPAPVRFSGMPLPRWWAMEDGKTNFAAVSPDSTDLARLIFLEFALVYSNDWYQLPCDLPVGSVAQIQGLAVTDTFGQKLWITPANAGDDEDWRRWSMFSLDTIGTTPTAAETSLLVPPSVPKVADGPVLEEVALIRDENANLVWGVEQTVRLATGESRRGSEVAAEMVAHRRQFTPEPPNTGPPRAAVAYEAMNVIPEQWIPFVPVHRENDIRSIRLQRAALPSAIDPKKAVRPRTQLLREGLDSGKAYYINEEEVPQSGTRLTASYNRTRWRDGRVVVWLSALRGSGRGEGSSGLRFDSLIDTKPAQQP